MSALKYWVWLTTLPGLGERARLQLLAHFGSPEEIYFAPEGELLLAEGITKLQAALLADKSLDRAERVLEDCAKDGQFVLYRSPSWPLSCPSRLPVPDPVRYKRVRPHSSGGCFRGFYR